MAPTSRLYCLVTTLTVAVVFPICGCQSTNSKWATAWKERTKPKPKFQGVDGEEQVTYWPYKSEKPKPKLTSMPESLKEKVARKNEQTQYNNQLAELMKEGDQLRKNGQPEEAAFAYNKALALSPDNPDLHRRLAILADNQHQYPLADEHYQAALRMRPRDPDLLSDIGYSYSLRGDTLRAEQTLKEALSIDPRHKRAMANLGSIYAKYNRRDEALAMFRMGATESEAQQYMAQLFPRDRTGSGAMPTDPNYGRSDQNLAASGNNQIDLSKLSFQQIQEEMARRKMDAQQRRQQSDDREKAQMANAAAGDRRNQLAMEQSLQSESMARGSGNPIVIGPGVPGSPNMPRQQNSEIASWQTGTTASAGTGTQFDVNAPYGQNQAGASPNRPNLAPAQIFRGPSAQPRPVDPQVQPAMGQQNPTNLGSNVQQANGLSNSSRMALQLGMSAGPGNMFPMVPQPSVDGANSGIRPASYDNRSGNEQQNSSGAIDQTGSMSNPADPLADGSVNFAAQFEGSAPIAPSSPTTSWGGNFSNSTSWTGEPQQLGGGTGTGELGNDQASWAQTSMRRNETFDSMQSGDNVSMPTRGQNEASRPFNGSWPNSNSLPARQLPPGNSQGLRGGDMSVRMNTNLTDGMMAPSNGSGNLNPMGQAGSNNNAANGSLPQWPFAPNR